MMPGGAGPSPWAWRLGYGGLVPFVGLAGALWIGWPADPVWVNLALLGYGAIIASFLGAIHWGLVMRDGSAQSVPSLLWGVVPGLAGWLALMLGPASGPLVMTALLWLCFAVDRVLYPRFGLRAWLPMRLRLTLVASISCVAAAAAAAA